ncbi:MAG: hypothetical protein ACK4UN_10025 [Limisphaerales bacterium]
MEQLKRCEKICKLAGDKQNLTLTLVAPHLNPYRDISPDSLAKIETNVRKAFFSAIPNGNIPVISSADDHVNNTIDLTGAKLIKRKGRRLDLLISNRNWFDNNWNVFAGNFGFGTRRSVFVFSTLYRPIPKTDGNSMVGS